mmetsp:Transcript_9800/g.21237  ORF Transcript_9800/g.21237 Transcript_9800/m.21237 type:complete len:81 (-) Transcript_9800:1163-1405(-)
MPSLFVKATPTHVYSFESLDDFERSISPLVFVGPRVRERQHKTRFIHEQFFRRRYGILVKAGIRNINDDEYSTGVARVDA